MSSSDQATNVNSSTTFTVPRLRELLEGRLDGENAGNLHALVVRLSNSEEQPLTQGGAVAVAGSEAAAERGGNRFGVVRRALQNQRQALQDGESSQVPEPDLPTSEQLRHADALLRRYATARMIEQRVALQQQQLREFNERNQEDGVYETTERARLNRLIETALVDLANANQRIEVTVERIRDLFPNIDLLLLSPPPLPTVDVEQTTTPSVSQATVTSVSSTTTPSVSPTTVTSVSSITTPSVSPTTVTSVSSTTAPSVSSTTAPSVSSITTPSVSPTTVTSVSQATAPSVSSTTAPISQATAHRDEGDDSDDDDDVLRSIATLLNGDIGTVDQTGAAGSTETRARAADETGTGTETRTGEQAGATSQALISRTSISLSSLTTLADRPPTMSTVMPRHSSSSTIRQWSVTRTLETAEEGRRRLALVQQRAAAAVGQLQTTPITQPAKMALTQVNTLVSTQNILQGSPQSRRNLLLHLHNAMNRQLLPHIPSTQAQVTDFFSTANAESGLSNIQLVQILTAQLRGSQHVEIRSQLEEILRGLSVASVLAERFLDRTHQEAVRPEGMLRIFNTPIAATLNRHLRTLAIVVAEICKLTVRELQLSQQAEASQPEDASQAGAMREGAGSPLFATRVPLEFRPEFNEDRSWTTSLPDQQGGTVQDDSQTEQPDAPQTASATAVDTSGASVDTQETPPPPPPPLLSDTEVGTWTEAELPPPPTGESDVTADGQQLPLPPQDEDDEVEV